MPPHQQATEDNPRPILLSVIDRMAAGLPVEGESELLSHARQVLGLHHRELRAQAATSIGLITMSSTGSGSPCSLRLSR